MSEKIIFLDFDGPLSNPRVILYAGHDNAIDPVAIGALNNLCEATGIKIVCTSTRTIPGNQENFEETVAMLALAGLNPEHLHKDWSCFYDMVTPRKAHICQWLSEHPEVTHYAIIDDEAVGLPHMVRVTEMDGLQVRHFEKLAKLLDFKLIDVFNRARQKAHDIKMMAERTMRLSL